MRSVSKQGHLEPRCHSEARLLSRNCKMVYWGVVDSEKCGLGGAQKELVSSSWQVPASMVPIDMSACLFYRDSSEYKIGSMQRVVYFLGSHGWLSWYVTPFSWWSFNNCALSLMSSSLIFTSGKLLLKNVHFFHFHSWSEKASPNDIKLWKSNLVSFLSFLPCAFLWFP